MHVDLCYMHFCSFNYFAMELVDGKCVVVFESRVFLVVRYRIDDVSSLLTAASELTIRAASAYHV